MQCLQSRGYGTTWKHIVIYSFNPNTWDGCYSNSRVVIDGAGHLFGTTIYGGDHIYGAV